ncbi:hypothetical protein [Meiothermus sp. CFH 77666]|uniref:hypothetical protein n=1 Tax=Meiothermus sp. CFH 77666 TaxID=2817942 RepID=UPI001AA06DAE|nr:hypothetical protein [Meiothermus sp. CFH 77666]
MIIVNSHWLHQIFATLGEGNEERAQDIANLNMINPSSIRKLVENHIRPYFEFMPRKSAQRVKESWRYALSALPNSALQALHLEDELELPFELPHDVRKFFQDIWEEMFPGEPWQIEDLSVYQDYNTKLSDPFNFQE